MFTEGTEPIRVSHKIVHLDCHGTKMVFFYEWFPPPAVIIKRNNAP